jgi:hypothetical protein
MYLYCIINGITAKTHATITNIVRQVILLRELMIQKDSDVQAFKTSVLQLTNAYFAHKHEKADQE